MSKRSEEIKAAMRSDVFTCPSPTRCIASCPYWKNNAKASCLLDFARIYGQKGAEWADDHPESKYNLSDVDLLVSQLDGIIHVAERLTSGNVAHNKAEIILFARAMKRKCFTIKEI